MRKIRVWMWFGLMILLAACSPVGDGQTPDRAGSDEPGVSTPSASATSLPTHTLTATASPTLTPLPTETPIPTLTSTPTPIYFSGAGDVAICGQQGDDLTAALLREKVGSGLFFIAGDASNEDGTLYQYENCFQPSWGALMPDLRVVPGNHDYYSNPLENYWVFFDGIAGEPGKGWYSFEHGDWHIVMLNSNCGFVGCGPSSEQLAWLKEDLAASDAVCTMAVWHHPVFNSGPAGNAHWLYYFWEALYEHGADVVVSGHDHHYERIARVDPLGVPDGEFGIRSFIVGTGGAGFYGIEQILPISEVRKTGQFGIIQFELHPDGYEWQFINVEGEVLDVGADSCSEGVPD